jgi:hypothetical protein
MSSEPVTANAEQAALECLDRYMAAWDARDAAALAASFNAPALMLSGSRAVAVLDLDRQAAEMIATLKATGWHHSTWIRREVLHHDVDKVHFDVRFTRHREDGTQLGTFEGVYIVTCNRGHWGVQMVSAIQQEVRAEVK